jgi:hypothetical protein
VRTDPVPTFGTAMGFSSAIAYVSLTVTLPMGNVTGTPTLVAT